MLRLFSILALMVLGGTTFGNDKREHAPMPRTTVQPWNLKYLPTQGNTVIAIRPSQLMNKPSWSGYRDYLGEGVKALLPLFGGEPNADDLPNVADVDQILIRSTFQCEADDNAEKISLGYAFTDDKKLSFVVTMNKPFDWVAMLKKWYPRAAVRRSGQETTIVVNKVFNAKPLQILVPNDRTLVVCWDEEQYQSLMDSLTQRREPVAPVGWVDEPNTVLMIALDNTANTVVSGPPKPKKAKIRQVMQIGQLVKSATLVMLDGETETAQVTFRTETEKAAAQTEQLIPRMVKTAGVTTNWPKSVKRVGTEVRFAFSVASETPDTRVSLADR